MNGASISQDAEASGASVSPPHEYASSFHGTLGCPEPSGLHRRKNPATPSPATCSACGCSSMVGPLDPETP